MLSASRAPATGRRLLRGSLAQTGLSCLRIGQRAGIITAGDDIDSHDDFKPKVRAEKATQTVQDHVEQDIKENPVMVYMKGVPDAPQCGFSAMVVRILKEYDVSYNSRNVLADPELREGIKQFSHWPTIPQVFINGEFVGGSDILINMHRSGELEKLLEQTKHKQSSDGVETGSSYEEAVAVIDTLIHRGPASDSVANGKINWAGHFAQTFKHLKILELEEPLERLSIIHVAGTKGKGSTCAFAESMLRVAGFRTGLFTSPHLLDICERFRFDGLEVSRDVFAEHFWWCYNRLQANTNIAPMPGFFRFMTLLALRMFIIEKVDVAILEVGLGGRLDATNVVRAPAVCGIASLGYDHMDLLGNTLREIASEKAGIFKAGVPVVTAPQPEEAMEALQRRAEELKIPLTVASPVESYGLPNLKLGLRGEHQRINAALAIALCRHWAKRSGNEEHLSKALQAGGLPESYILGLASTHWPGRAEIIHDQFVSEDEKSTGHGRHPQSSRLQFYLDGAHSPESMEACAKWFCDTVKAESITSCVVESDYGGNGTISLGHKNVRRVLLFNCMPKRDPTSLLPPLVNLCTQQDLPFHMAFFAPPASSLTSLSSLRSQPGNAVNQPDLSWQLTIQKCWESLKPTMTQESNGGTSQVASNDTSGQEFYAGLEEQKEVCHILNSSSAVMSSLPGTLEWIRSCARRHPQLQIQVLVTGSLYLVGDMLKLLKH